MPSLKHGRAAALDLAITSPQTRDSLRGAAQSIGSAAVAYVVYKRGYLGTAEDCEGQGMDFIPIVAETSGGWGPSAICTFKALAKCILSEHESTETPLQQHLQRTCTAIRRANARAVLRRQPAPALADTAMRDAAALLQESPDAGPN